jgi:predicted DNA binding CopG/RHH family protein
MSQQMYDLEKDEEQILAAVESGEFESVLDFDAGKKKLRQYAKNTLNKTRNINIRISERDLQRLKAKAIEEGIPYQTLAASILHKTAIKKY